MIRTIQLLALVACLTLAAVASAEQISVDGREYTLAEYDRRMSSRDQPGPQRLPPASEQPLLGLSSMGSTFWSESASQPAAGNGFAQRAPFASSSSGQLTNRHDTDHVQFRFDEQLLTPATSESNAGGSSTGVLPRSISNSTVVDELPLPGADDWFEALPNGPPEPEWEDSVLGGADPQGLLLAGSGETSVLAARFGWWSVRNDGSPTKVGEYQSLASSPFFDLDGLFTNGVHTWDFHATNLDNDARNVYLNWFSPSVRANLQFESFLRRLDRDPLNFYVDFNQQPARPLPGPPANFRDMKEDRAPGEDFAIRVEQLNSSFQGQLTENLTWRLNVWALRKHGERQANAMAHCFSASNATDTNGNPAPGPACHQLSQRQRIDWLTAEVQPVLQYKMKHGSLEYSRTMRTLTTDDQVVTRLYDNYGFTGEQPYASVPENYTYIDQLKLGAAFPEHRDFYARAFNGNTRNEFRDTNRRFSGFDIRLTDQSVDGLSVTCFAKKYVQSGQFPSFLLPFESASSIRFPLGYDRTTAGVTTSWRPFAGEYSARSRLRLSSGYEYRELDRENAIYQESALTVNQASTLTNQFHLRAATNWASTCNSYVVYRLSFIDDPLFGVPIGNTTTNSSLPTQAHRVELGNSWAPTQTFMLHNLLGIYYGSNFSDIANFETNNYDFVLSAWYAPTPLWSFSAGLGLYSNWIDQDITLGSKVNPLTLPWEYGGRSSVVNFGSTYQWTQRTTLSATIDLVRGKNTFDALAPYPDLPFLSDVIVETTRFTGGVDYALGPQSGAYVRYQLFDYDDKSDGFVSGRTEMVLFGLHGRF